VSTSTNELLAISKYLFFSFGVISAAPSAKLLLIETAAPSYLGHQTK
jgi:hypothetical protein